MCRSSQIYLSFSDCSFAPMPREAGNLYCLFKTLQATSTTLALPSNTVRYTYTTAINLTTRRKRIARLITTIFMGVKHVRERGSRRTKLYTNEKFGTFTLSQTENDQEGIQKMKGKSSHDGCRHCRSVHTTYYN